MRLNKGLSLFKMCILNMRFKPKEGQTVTWQDFMCNENLNDLKCY